MEILKIIDDATNNIKLFIEDRGTDRERHSLKNDLALLRNWADKAAREVEASQYGNT